MLRVTSQQLRCLCFASASVEPDTAATNAHTFIAAVQATWEYWRSPTARTAVREVLEEGKSSSVSGGVRGGLAPPEKTHRHLEMQHTLLGLLRQKSRAPSGIHGGATTAGTPS